MDYEHDYAVPRDQYWASVEVELLAPILNKKIDEYLEDLSATGRIDLYRRAVRLYFGLDPDGGWQNSAALTFTGTNGETVMLRLNQFRSLLRSMVTIVTGARPAFKARPKSADTHAVQEAMLAESILDYYINDYGIEDDAVLVAVFALLMGEGWIESRWDVNAGTPYDVEELPVHGQDAVIEENAELEAQFREARFEYQAQAVEAQDAGEDPSAIEPPAAPELRPVQTYQKIRYTGDMKFRALKPEDVVRDIEVEDLDRAQWFCVRDRRNRWDLVAEFPEFRDKILNVQRNERRASSRVRTRARGSSSTEDLVDVWEFWHVRCDALPQGRYAMLIDDVILVDTPMPYDDVPLIPMVPSFEFDTPYGYGESWDLMALQQAYDAVFNTIVSNHAAFGLQNIWTPPGSNLELRDLGGGLKHIESLHKPESLDLLPANSISLELAEAIKSVMQAISGINDVTRGEAQASQSGSALAMMASIAVQYNSSLQRAYGQLWERLGTHIVRIFQRWASIPRTIEVAGKMRIPQIREVSGSDIEKVSSITVDLGNPIMRTAAGKKETADKLLSAKSISAEQYMEVQATGRLEAVYNRPRSQRTLIESENERMMTGEEVICLITDNHAEHIAEHTVLLNEPGIRFDDAVVRQVDLHIRAHAMQWAQADPLILAATGQSPPPPGMWGGGALPQTGAAPPGGGPGPGAEQAPMGPAMGQGGAASAGKEPAMPQMPKMPDTGERVPQGGALS